MSGEIDAAGAWARAASGSCLRRRTVARQLEAIRDRLRQIGAGPGVAAIAGVNGLAEALRVLRQASAVDYEGAASDLEWDENGDGAIVSGLLEFIDLDGVIVTDSGNPIADLAALGHGLLNAALAAVVALIGAATASDQLRRPQ